jgi:aminoglycoside phosphotransferase (APT) family kinase protein
MGAVMTSELLEKLQQLDSSMLTELVRSDQNSASFEILDWMVQPLSHEKVISITGGLYQFSGQRREGAEIKPWSIILKILVRPDGWCLDPQEWCYWKRELLAFQSGMLAELPKAIHAPRCYGVTEYESEGWVWLEHIVETTERVWSLDHYEFAARQMGRSAGAFLDGTASLPGYRWLTAFFRSNQKIGGFAETRMDSESPESVWHHPLVKSAFVEPLRSRILSVFVGREYFFDALDRLPQVFCHNDLHRRNLMIRTDNDGQQELIVLDWAFCGVGAVGTDMGELVASSLYFWELDPSQAIALETVVLEGYLAGLGISLPFWTSIMLGEELSADVIPMYGRSSEVILPGWVKLGELWMERADEARHLIKALRIL